MLKDFRSIWRENQYQRLGTDASENLLFFGREKKDRYQVFARRWGQQKRWLHQSVALDQDWFWDTRKQRLTAEAPPPDHNFALPPVEDLLRGYSWNPKITDLSDKISVHEITLTTGATALCLIPADTRAWIVSLHGGPESYEHRAELRYGGLYRDLLRKNIAVVILNYAGSNELGLDATKKVWGRWRASIGDDFSVLLNLAANRYQWSRKNLSLLGVSFGGALALSLHKDFCLSRTVLSSPLLDLSTQRARGGTEFEKWFDSRFSTQDMTDFSFEILTAQTQGVIAVYYGRDDEVLGSERFGRLERSAQGSPTWQLHPQISGHVPHRYFEAKKRFGGLLNSLSTHVAR